MADQDNGLKRATHYKRILAGGSAGASPFENRAETVNLDDAAITTRIDASTSELHRIIKEHLEDNDDLHKIADQIASDGRDALKAVADNDAEKLADARVISSLEVVVRTDGSRPSFMVRNGAPDRSTSPIGNWGATLTNQDAILREALQCVCRINEPSSAQGFQGTGTLVGRNVVLTNLHVLQAIASRQPDASWKLKPDVNVDFGHEFRAQQSIGRRKVTSVLFAGERAIVGSAIDHSKLDLALLGLEPAPATTEIKTLDLDASPDWGGVETGIFICGYPGNPGLIETPSLLEQLFRSTYGCKRVAPGNITASADQVSDSARKWTVGHDATTLGGNSGSMVVVIGREKATAGLHYGGRRADPRENWCHILGLALDEKDDRTHETLRKIFESEGVKLVDPFAE